MNENNTLAEETLDGRVAVVTGSSTGIGRAAAVRLARAGADVLIHAATNRQSAEETADTVRKLGRSADVTLFDIQDLGKHHSFVNSCWNWKGHIDVWVNNAGADVLTGEKSELSFDEKLQLLWDVDVKGTIGLSREIGSLMSKTKAGSIVNVGWDQVDFGMAGDSGEMFTTIKGAIMAFSRSLARTLAPTTRVNCVAPGWIKTSWGGAASEYWQERAKKESLLNRWGTPDDVAEVICFLASPQSSFVTGQVIPVNGGYRGEMLS